MAVSYADIEAKKLSFSAGQYFEVKIEYIELTSEEFAEKMNGYAFRLDELFTESHRLEVEINPILVSFGEISTEIEKMVSSDDDMYQICAHATSDFTELVFKDYFRDLYELNYINFDKPWWSQTFNEEAEIMDKLYVTTGSLALSLTRYMFAIFYNKGLAADYAADYPELSDLYSIVEGGDWTYDKFYELGNSIYTDNNGDTLKDEEDTYGIGFQSCIGADVIWSSFDINILSPNDEGWFDIDVPTEKLYTALENMHTLLYDTTGCFNAGISDSDLNVLSAMFASDNLLFMNNELLAIESATLRNMQNDYGILPFPKYDEKQETYYSLPMDWYTSFAIPRTNQNPDAAAAVLEALASYSYRDTMPAYLDTALKGRYMSDPQSRKMLDLVVDGFKVDAAWIYYKTIGAGFPSTFRPSSTNTSYASEYSKAANVLKIKLTGYKVTSKFS